VRTHDGRRSGAAASNGHFRITLTLPADARAALYRLTSTVRENSRSRRGFATYSLPLPVAVG